MSEEISIQLKDLVEAHPMPTDPNFQKLIGNKLEYSELAGEKNEKLGAGKRLYNHQKLAGRFLRQYDNVIILDEPGTGKTTVVLNFTEYVRDQNILHEYDPAAADEKLYHFKRVYVICSKTQKQEIKKQLVCKIADPRRYITQAVNSAKDERQQQKAVTMETNKFYTFSTYTTFARRITEKYPNTVEGNMDLANDFADTIFWLDEAHSLVTKEGSEEDKRQKQLTYETIWRVFHLAPRSKVIVSTATPGINGEDDIGLVFNLALPENGRMPVYYDYTNVSATEQRLLFPDIPSDFNLANYTREELNPYYRGQIPEGFLSTATLEEAEVYFRGRIQYVRALETGAQPKAMGERVEDFLGNGIKTIVFPSYMSEFQSVNYLPLLRDVSGQPKAGFGTEIRQASNIVYPDGSSGSGKSEEDKEAEKKKQQVKKELQKLEVSPFSSKDYQLKAEQNVINTASVVPEDTISYLGGSSGAGKYISVGTDGSFRVDPGFTRLVRDGELPKLSSKLANIADMVINKPGNAFVYCEFLGTGVYTIAACLEALGLTRFDERNSIFVGEHGGNRSYCSAAQSSSNRKIRGTYLKKLYQNSGRYSYGILSREITDQKRATLFEAMNSPENMNGDIIKVFICSSVGRDGINVSNVLQVHIVGPEWIPGALIQAEARSLRSTSHEDILNIIRQNLILEGRDPADATVNVEIYRHASIPVLNGEPRPDWSHDLLMYSIAEKKARKIARVMRMAKQCSFTCGIHWGRNVRETDEDYSPECDYDICQYQCVQTSDAEDRSTYDVLYINDIVQDVIVEIVELFSNVNALNLKQIVDALPEYYPKYINFALEKIITTRHRIIDRFGFISYLQEDRGGFYLTRYYPSGSKLEYSLSIYTQGIIANSVHTLPDIVSKFEGMEYQDLDEKLEMMNIADIPGYLVSLPQWKQVEILENAIYRRAIGYPSPSSEEVIRKFRWFVYEMREPSQTIEEIRNTKQNTVQIGRPPKPGVVKLKKVRDCEGEGCIDELDQGELVYLHTLASSTESKVKYNEVKEYLRARGKIRILKLSEESGWRNTNEFEKPVYNELIQRSIRRTFNNLAADTEYYGHTIGGVFRLVNRKEEQEKSGDDGDSNDKHSYRGKVCGSWNGDELLDIMWRIGMPLPSQLVEGYDDVTLSRKDLIAALDGKYKGFTTKKLNSVETEKLVFYYNWIIAGKNPKGFCPYVRMFMEEQGTAIEIS